MQKFYNLTHALLQLIIPLLLFSAANSAYAQSLNKYFNSNKTGKIERSDATTFQMYVTQILDKQFVYVDSCKAYIAEGKPIVEGDISILLTNIGKYSRSTQQGCLMEEVFDDLCKKRSIDFSTLNFQKPALYTLLQDYYNQYNGNPQAQHISLLTFKNLIENGASINTSDLQGHNLLILASDIGDKDFQEYLIKKGFNALKQTNKGNTAIDQAIAKGDVATIKLLNERGQLNALNISNCFATREQIHANTEIEKIVVDQLSKSVVTYDDIIRFRQLVSIPNKVVKDKESKLLREMFPDEHNLRNLTDHLKRYPNDSAVERLLLNSYNKDLKVIDNLITKIKAGGSLKQMLANWDKKFLRDFVGKYYKQEHQEDYPLSLLPNRKEYITLVEKIETLKYAEEIEQYQRKNYLVYVKGRSYDHLKRYLTINAPTLSDKWHQEKSTVEVFKIVYEGEYPPMFSSVQKALKQRFSNKVNTILQHLNDEEKRVAQLLKKQQDQEHARANKIYVVSSSDFRGTTFYKMSDGEEFWDAALGKIDQRIDYRVFGVSTEALPFGYRGTSGYNSSYIECVYNAVAAAYAFKKYGIVRTTGIVK